LTDESTSSSEAASSADEPPPIVTWTSFSAPFVELAKNAAEQALDRVRRHPVLGEVYEFVDGVFIDYSRDHGSMYAGALTFYAIVSLIPLTVLFASAFGYFVAGGDVDAGLAEVVRQLRKVLPYLSASFGEDLRVVVEHRSKLGVVGFVALLWAASEVFRAVEFATARIFARLDEHDDPDEEKTRVRSVFKTKLLFGVVVTATSLAALLVRLLATLLATVRQQLHLPEWTDHFLGDPFGETSVLGVALTALAFVIGFVVMVRVFSPHVVLWRFAFFGGGLFYVFFALARRVYDLYLAKLTDLDGMYGSFATLFVLILWIYYCAVLLLMCLHVVKVAQRRSEIGPRWPKDGRWLLVR
jgi:YihY family inner membrane protein